MQTFLARSCTICTCTSTLLETDQNIEQSAKIIKKHDWKVIILFWTLLRVVNAVARLFKGTKLNNLFLKEFKEKRLEKISKLKITLK